MRLIIAFLLAAALSACSADQESPEAEPPSASPSAPETSESPEPGQPDASATPACAEVREGIDAFNRTEFANTVAHFRLAVPLARARARTAPSPAADDLVEAVVYYAGLAPEDYPLAARSAPEFAKYKAITLAQCAPLGGPPLGGSPEPPGVTT